MLESALPLLRCPACRAGGRLTPGDVARDEGGAVVEGPVHCSECQAVYAIRNRVLDVSPPGQTGKSLAQRLMEARPVVAIYERHWRPALVNLVEERFGFEEEFSRVEELLSPRPGQNLVDFACGPGNYTRRWARLVDENNGRTPDRPRGIVVGIDRSVPMLEEAVRQARAEGIRNVCFVRADVHEPPLRDAVFAGGSCLAALHLFDNPAEFLDEVARVLAPGGRFSVMTLRRSGGPAAQLAQGVIERAGGVRFFEEAQLLALFRRAGLEVATREERGAIWLLGARCSANAVARE